MIKEKNPLLELKLQRSVSFLMNFYNNNIESLYDLYEILLEAPFENIYFEIIHILFGYCQFMTFLFDVTVRSIFIIIPFSFYQFGIKYQL